MEFKLTGKCVLTLDHTKGEKTSKHVHTDFNLDVSSNLSRSDYFGKDELPNEAGVKSLTQCFIQGLVGNIHYANQNGMWNDVEHLKYIIAELERGFTQVANVHESEFPS